ncbi:hypothetical protein ABZ438_08505 [Streptomyces sp. NPDC005786]|uniref:hypothetical protein n=1 Tax=Streptomyces sp. NPDC005786 TaxID=3154891 RepID=UPI0033C4E535
MPPPSGARSPGGPRPVLADVARPSPYGLAVAGDVKAVSPAIKSGAEAAGTQPLTRHAGRG